MPLFYLCLAFLGGVLFAPLSPWPAWPWLAVAGSCTLWAAVLPSLGDLGSGPRSPVRRGAGVGAGLIRFRGAPGVRRLIPGRRQGQSAAGGRAALLRGLLARLHLDPAAVPPVLLRRLPLLLIAVAAAGAARWISTQPDLHAPDFIAFYNDTGRRVSVTGTLAAPPDEREGYTNLRIAVEAIRPADGFRHSEVRGLLLARVDPGTDFAYGDRVVVTAKLETPPEDEDFSYREYLARQGVYSLASFAEGAVLESGGGNPVLRALFGVRERAFEVLHQLFPDPEASLLAGILLGIESGLSPDLADAFRDTGTAHIIAISGFNISILAAIFTSAFGRLLGPRPGAAAAIAAVLGYTVLVGADPAVLRAAVMGVLVIVFRRAARPADGLHTLVLAAAVMVYLNPALPGDAGFQLSFAATAGLIFYAEPLTRAFARWASRYLRISVVRRILPWVSDAVLLTLAAQLATLPVIVYHFERLSLSAFLANPLVLPVQPAVMVLGGLAVIGGLAWLPLGRLLASGALPFVSYTIRLVEIFAGLRGGVLVVGGAAFAAALALAVAPALLAGLRRVGWGLAQRFPAWRAGLLTLLIVLAAGAWRADLARAPGLLRVVLLDVGMGEALLVHTPGDRWLLINGGASAAALSDGLGRRIPVSQRTLDWLVVAGTRDEQLAALPRALEAYRPEAVLWSGLQNNSRINRNVQEMMLKQEIALFFAEPGQRLDLGGGAELRVLAVGKRGAVLRLAWGAFSLLLPVGIDFEGLGAAPPPSGVLLLAESGFGPLNPPEWLAAVDPGLILLSVAAGNREGLPSPEVEAQLADYNLLRTDRDGWVEIVTDGAEVWVFAQK